MISTSKGPAPYFLLLCSLLPWQGAKAAEVRCFPEVHCEGELIQTVFTPRECCIENARGVAYDYSGQIEKCHTCEVIGWKQAHVYAIEDSVISILFGANRGAAETRYRLNVEYISNEANTTMLDKIVLSRIVYRATDIEVKVRLPRYSSSDRNTAKNTTLRMAKQIPATLGEAQFIYPEEVTLHVVVPEVSFESSSFRVDWTENLAVPVCLYYSNTGGGYAQFSINISVNISAATEDGGFFKTFDFSTLSGRSCDSVSLPLSAIHDPFTDTIFSAAIVHQDQPPFELGPHSSAGLIINALKVPEVQFEDSLVTYTLPVTSMETCLVRASPDEMDSTLPLTVNVSLSRDTGFTALSEIITVVFAENSTKSCLTTPLTLPEQRPQRLTLTIVSTFNISVFELPHFKVGGRRYTVIMVEEEPQPTLESVGTPEGGREGEGEGEKEGEEEEEGEEEVATGSGDNTGLDVVGNDKFALNSGSSDSNSDGNSLIIGLSVTAGVLLLAISIVFIIVVGIWLYSYHYGSYGPSSHERTGSKDPCIPFEDSKA
jgi:hypothetical protein